MGCQAETTCAAQGTETKGQGIVVCAMAGARRRRGFEPRFVCPSRGPPVRSPPPPPAASPSTIGTAGGRLACLVLVFLSLSTEPWLTKTRQQTRHTCSSALRHWYRRPPGGAFLPRIPLPLACGGGIELGSSGCSRLRSRCSTPPETPPCGPRPPPNAQSMYGAMVGPVRCPLSPVPP